MDIETRHGPAAAAVDGPPDPPYLTVLTHGSAGGVDAADLMAVRAAVLARGGAVARVTQPFRLAGRRAPGSAVKQDEAWLDIIAALRRSAGAGVPLVQGGRSNGARVVCRTAADAGAAAVVTLAFPLHPPGRPEKSRLDELTAAAGRVPVLVVNGDRDPFGVPPAVDGVDLCVRPGERHALDKRPAEIGDLVGDWIAAAVQDHLK